jgi:DNA-binding NarL/FixJ family response regulator
LPGALPFGAKGIVTKLAGDQELVTAVQKVAASETYLCTGLTAMMADVSSLDVI